MKNLNLWIGIEATLNRVGGQYFDQLQKSGHYSRPFDLHLFAKLNPQRIRYPFLWEKAAPEKEGNYDWSLFDKNLQKLKEQRLTPIVGLLHHGSGPRYTDLLDPEFPAKLAHYAKDFASRYPELTDYTPINEILTTARFSCLYGHWYPHHRSDKSFIRAVYNECRATVLAMQEIKKINPKARLIQTEDIGRTESTKTLEYQRDFDNARRWLSFDFLCGNVNEQHFLYDFLRQELTTEEIRWFTENSFPPDVLGVNHYLLSNRFLDERVELYPAHLHGGNNFQAYADIGTVDLDAKNRISPYSVFKEVWERYHIPLAITEVHARGFREDQMRWFLEIWNSAKKLMTEKIPVEGLTAWSLLGTFDWNSLCTVDENFYEPGVFDLRTPTGEPRPTGLYNLIKTLATNEKTTDPVLQTKGWWNSGPRLYSALNQEGKKPIIITGGSGTLGKAFARICSARNIPFVLVNRNQLDTGSILQVREILDNVKPWAVINTAGHVNLDDAEKNDLLCFRENIKGPKILAEQCNLRSIPFITFSSDQVFDGEKNVPYVEKDAVSPLNVYGQSKAIAEKKVLSIHDRAMVVRTSSFFGPWDNANFVVKCLRSIQSNNYFPAANDIFMSPTYVPDLVHACLDLLIDGQYGVIHLANSGVVSWAEFAEAVISFYSQPKTKYIFSHRTDEMPVLARRPFYSALASERFQILPSLEDSIKRFFQELEIPI